MKKHNNDYRYVEELSGERIPLESIMGVVTIADFSGDNWISLEQMSERMEQPNIRWCSLGDARAWRNAGNNGAIYVCYDDGAGFRWFPIRIE